MRFATLAENFPSNEMMGKIYGFVTVAIAVGTSGGPLVAGVLFDLCGYWVAWSSVLLIVIFDVILRCLMTETPSNANENVLAKPHEQDTERDALLPSMTQSDERKIDRSLHPRKREFTSFGACLPTVTSLVVLLVISVSPF